MAERALAARGVSLRVVYRLTPWWLRVSVIYWVARCVSIVLVMILASNQEANAWTGASPNYLDFAGIWDGRWYHIVAVNGYPNALPVDDAGFVTENAWAFMPVYPLLVRALMELSGGGWSLMAVVVSLLCGWGGALLFYRLLRRVIAPDQAMFAVVLLCFGPLSPLYGFAYAESLYLLLLTAALLLLLQRRYLALMPVVAVMAFTRPSGLAFALALGLHWIVRWWHRRTEPFSVGERLRAASVAVFSGLMGLGWVIAAGAVTGDARAYIDTELAWRSAYIGHGELVPFTAWFSSGGWWLGAPWGYVVVTALIAAFGVMFFLPAVRRLGVDLCIWVLSYGLYLLAVFFPQSSTFRLLMPMHPLLGAIAQPRSRVYRICVVLLCIVGQWGWLMLCWVVNGADWTPP